MGWKLLEILENDNVRRFLKAYIAFAIAYVVIGLFLRLKARNPVRRLAAFTRSRQERIRKRPERFGSWSISTDDILNLPY